MKKEVVLAVVILILAIVGYFLMFVVEDPLFGPLKQPGGFQNTFERMETAPSDGSSGGPGLETIDYGYTLYTPRAEHDTVYLIDNEEDVFHSWNIDSDAGATYLLDDGRLLTRETAGATIRDWEGNILWRIDLTELPRQHHDVEMMPNGNVLIVSRDLKNYAESIAAGRDPAFMSDNEVMPVTIYEVNPDEEIVWEWHIWDHLIQDFDPTKDNYGNVGEHPELMDLNYGRLPVSAWTHVNTVDYNEEFDQIVLSSRTIDEFWIIDHSTTTEEAASHFGGNSGKGGDFLYRWGNPEAYRAGDESDKKLYGPHDIQWIKSGLLGEGRMMVFNNGWIRPEGAYSSIEEIVVPIDGNGNYYLAPGEAYGPEELVWIYTAENPTDFYAQAFSGTQRLPGGNTLICEGNGGRLFEVTRSGEKVWEYQNNIPTPSQSDVFKIRRYYPPFIWDIPTLRPTENVLHLFDLTPFVTDHDTDDENLVLTEDSDYAEIVGFELQLLYPPGVLSDVINFTVTDGIFTTSKNIDVEMLVPPPLRGFFD